MRVAVVGAGGVGGYFGGKLAHAGVDTTFIVRGATLQALLSKGLRVESVEGDFSIPNVQATDDPSSIGQVDVILIAVKAWQVAEVAAQLHTMIGPDTAVVPLENGVEAPEILSGILGREHVLGGLCAIVSFIVEPGHIRHAAFKPLVMFGELDNHRSDRTTRLREAFLQAGVKAEVPEDMHHSMWSKFLFITPMSGIGAITRVPVDVWRVLPELKLLAEQMLNEIIAVAAARGIALGDDAVERTWQRYLAMAPGSTASLQRDLMEGRPSELDAQLGAVVRLGRDCAVPTPLTDLLYHCLLPQERIARQKK